MYFKRIAKAREGGLANDYLIGVIDDFLIQAIVMLVNVHF